MGGICILISGSMSCRMLEMDNQAAAPWRGSDAAELETLARGMC